MLVANGSIHSKVNAMVILMITNIVTLNADNFHNFNLYSLNKDVLKDSYKNLFRKNNTCMVLVSLLTTTDSNDKKINFVEIHKRLPIALRKVT